MKRLLGLFAFLFVASAIGQITIDREGRWLCELRDGSTSQHNEQKEAIERCTNEALAEPGRVFRITPPSYRVLADATAQVAVISSGADGSSGDPEIPDGGPQPEAEPYNLYYSDSTTMRGTIPFAYEWPTPPQGTLTPLSVTDGASLATALATPNAEITVSAGSYGTLAIAQDDQRWILNDAAVFSGLSATGRPARIEINGGEIDAGTGDITLIVDDWLLNNVCVSAVSTLAVGLGDQQSNRYALIHSTVVALRYAHFTPGLSAVPNKGDSHILAGNHLEGGMTVGNSGVEATIRTQGINNVVIVDNWIRNGFDGQGVKHTLRSHYGQTNWWARNNLIPHGDGVFWNSTGGTGAEQIMGLHYFYDNAHYVASGDGGGTPPSAHLFRTSSNMPLYWPNPSGAITVAGNRAYDYRASGPTSTRFFLNGQAWDTLSDNIEDVYETPPMESSWLVDGDIAPGCDH